jgi:hypothetical protein
VAVGGCLGLVLLVRLWMGGGAGVWVIMTHVNGCKDWPSARCQNSLSSRKVYVTRCMVVSGVVLVALGGLGGRGVVWQRWGRCCHSVIAGDMKWTRLCQQATVTALTHLATARDGPKAMRAGVCDCGVCMPGQWKLPTGVCTRRGPGRAAATAVLLVCRCW